MSLNTSLSDQAAIIHVQHKHTRLARVHAYSGSNKRSISIYTAKWNRSGMVWTTTSTWYCSQWNGSLYNSSISVYTRTRTVLEPFYALV